MVSMGEQGRGADERSTLLQAKKGDRHRRLVSASTESKKFEAKVSKRYGARTRLAVSRQGCLGEAGRVIAW
ncbi:hypothetical protein THICB1_100297 [Thiomonas arsenitoxydans]|uniref:Transposase n=1 Tax=Thiomonas arsenitoxydans (strain DSM 22701 / CIP 110005 / 3As) TaxID=426114 RepID=A0ABM9T0B1_THIA3|nr:hypothetical protein THICB1_100297 [Thiomonas arsenitoxydans]CQR30525.1 hypothetical protein ACO3_240017 [Thiomonas arsenitoxydans]CQR30558.1 hypothetical protein ACO7_220018 [Thiomonas arsenitoxydans]CQR32062.1 hypothetical protein THICB6_160097 [Thiomonas arsenitoxydans]